MGIYRVRFVTAAEVTVEVEADDADTACDEAWGPAAEYLETLLPDRYGTYIDVSLDGIGAENAERLT